MSGAAGAATIMLAAAAAAPVSASAATTNSLSSFHDHYVGSVQAANGDKNPYGIAVVPLSVGKLVAGDVLVADFNNAANTPGDGTSIVQINPATGAKTVFASGLPIDGPVGIAINPVNDGVWVGNFGSTDGTTSSDVVLDPATGAVKATYNALTTGNHSTTASQQPTFDGVWGQGVSQAGSQTSFFYGTTGSGASGAGGGEIWRIDPHPTGTANGQPLNATYSEVATGLGDNATHGGSLPVTAANATGPEGFAYDPATATLYVSDDANNTIYALKGAATATAPITPRVVLHGGVLNHPEGIALDRSTGDLLVANGGSNTLTAINPQTGDVDGSRLLDNGPAGALFGLTAVTGPNGRTNILYVNDRTNTLHELMAPAAAVAITGRATQVTATTARLNGVIDTGNSSTTWQFQYGRSLRYGSGTPIRTITTRRGSVKVSFEIRHLQPGTVIHYRLVAISRGPGLIKSVGSDRSFRTKTTGLLLLGRRVLTVHSGILTVPLKCVSTRTCRGKFSVTTRVRVPRTKRFGTLLCATTQRFFVIRAHGQATIRVAVRPACRALLRKARFHRLTAKLTSAPRTGQHALIEMVELVQR